MGTLGHPSFEFQSAPTIESQTDVGHRLRVVSQLHSEVPAPPHAGVRSKGTSPGGVSQTDHYGQGNNHGPDRRTAVGVNGHARAAHVPRMLSVLFLRNARDDTHRDGIKYEGYVPCWPNRKRLGVAMDQFCTQGCRLLGLGRRMKGKTEQLVELGFHPVEGLEAALTRPGDGIRCRRFFLERRGQTGQMYFFNGSPTDAVFDLDRDEEPVLEWLGLRDMEDGDRCWFDLSARSL